MLNINYTDRKRLIEVIGTKNRQLKILKDELAAAKKDKLQFMAMLQQETTAKNLYRSIAGFVTEDRKISGHGVACP